MKMNKLYMAFLLTLMFIKPANSAVDISDSLETPAAQVFIKALPDILGMSAKVNTQQSLPENNYQATFNLINTALNKLANLNYSWACSLNKRKLIHEDVKQYTFTCSGNWPAEMPEILHKNKNIKNLTINLVKADVLAGKKWTVKPIITGKVIKKAVCTLDPEENPDCQKSILAYVQQNNSSTNSDKILAAINGGYFFIAKAGFFDSNCLWKIAPGEFKDFSKPISTAFLSDGLTIIDSQTYAYNCATFGVDMLSPDRATFTVNDAGKMEITNLASGSGVSTVGIKQALGSGPMMIQNGDYQMDWQAIPSTFEYSANTSVALAKDSSGNVSLILFTVDGKDKGNGMFSFEMANVLKTTLAKELGVTVTSAMSMDQGGSTTMVTCADNEDCVKISKAGNSNPNGRSVFNGLAIFSSSGI
jgi:hypothetical protein